jgi:hypothetical protein
MIMPVVYQDSIADEIDSEFGLGDTLQSFFFSPKKPTSGGWVWGVARLSSAQLSVFLERGIAHLPFQNSQIA